MKKLTLTAILIFLQAFLLFTGLHAQRSENAVQGVIYNHNDKPVSFALIIIPQAGIVTTTDQSGKYYIALPQPGTYTLTIKSDGFNDITTSVSVAGTTTKDFYLNLAIQASSGMKAVTIRGERDIQTVSRQTMTVKEIKEVPASLGDSINALTTLPGINRAGGLFGPMVIRGADPAMNSYFIDGIPLYKVMHFGGIHSVISNDLMSSIDLYSSSFPSSFNNTLGAVISINTLDDVPELGGFFDVGLISANMLIKTPFYKTTYLDGKEIKEHKGYMITSGRVGYITLLIPLFYEYVLGKSLDMLPTYWDYQFKTRYNFDSKHSLTFLAFGNKDRININTRSFPFDESSDPLLTDIELYQNDFANTQALTYKYHYSNKLYNSLLFYSALNQSHIKFNFALATSDWARDLGIKSHPYIFGLKDTLTMEWWHKHSTLNIGAEAKYYLFFTKGNSIIPLAGDGDINDPDIMQRVPLGDTYKNQTFSGYIENKFTFGGLEVVPGITAEHLSRGNNSYVDPRGLASYTFPSQTTIGLAGGWYSMFIQTNPFFFTALPYVAELTLPAMDSIHRAASIEQKISKYTIRGEVFYNTFSNIAATDVKRDENNELVPFIGRSGEGVSRGFELSAKVNAEEEDKLWGWVSYTLNNTKFISHVSEDFSEYGNMWLTSPFDMPHVIKVVLGYTIGKNTLSGRFQFNSTMPYDPIIGSYSDDVFTLLTGKPRNVPIYGKPSTGRFSPEYRLDVRYSRKTNYKWGYLSWYFEVIGLVNSSEEYLHWDYRYEYASGVNPKVKTPSDGLSFIPNFGVEVRF